MVQIPKHAILEMLRARSLQDQVAEAEERLPDVVDSEADVGLLSELGISADDLGEDGLGDLGLADFDEAGRPDSAGAEVEASEDVEQRGDAATR